jgi:hypothetical protein
VRESATTGVSIQRGIHHAQTRPRTPELSIPLSNRFLDSPLDKTLPNAGNGGEVADRRVGVSSAW